MFELKGLLRYKIPPDSRFGQSIIEEKDLLIGYPEEKGVIQDGLDMIISNTYLVEKTLQDMFYGVDMEIYLKTIYHYESEKDVFYGVDIKLKTHKDVGKFMRKNKIKNFLEANRNDT
jgi:hypothetical protein